MEIGGGAVLAQLIAQGAAQGADLATLRGIAEEAGELGATRALTRLGLADAGAGPSCARCWRRGAMPSARRGSASPAGWRRWCWG